MISDLKDHEQSRTIESEKLKQWLPASYPLFMEKKYHKGALLFFTLDASENIGNVNMITHEANLQMCSWQENHLLCLLLPIATNSLNLVG